MTPCLNICHSMYPLAWKWTPKLFQVWSADLYVRHSGRLKQTQPTLLYVEHSNHTCLDTQQNTYINYSANQLEVKDSHRDLFFSISVRFCSSPPPCISIRGSMKCERREESIERIIGKGCDLSCHLFWREGREARQGEEGDETKRGWREQWKWSGWAVLSSIAMFLKHKERMTKGKLYRCCGSGRQSEQRAERTRGMKVSAISRGGHTVSVVLVSGELLVTYFSC